MNRENVLFAVCGFLLGIIVGAFFLGEMVHDARAPGTAASRPATEAETATSDGSDNSEEVMTLVTEQIGRLNQILRVDPDNADALVQLGNLYMDAAKYSDAIGYYERSLAIRNDPSVATDLGICYRQSGQRDRALRLFEDVHRKNPTHWQALFNQAVVLVDMNEYAKARAAIAQLRQERPTDPEIVKFQKALAQMGPQQ